MQLNKTQHMPTHKHQESYTNVQYSQLLKISDKEKNLKRTKRKKMPYLPMNNDKDFRFLIGNGIKEKKV